MVVQFCKLEIVQNAIMEREMYYARFNSENGKLCETPLHMSVLRKEAQQLTAQLTA